MRPAQTAAVLLCDLVGSTALSEPAPGRDLTTLGAVMRGVDLGRSLSKATLLPDWPQDASAMT